jgi:hypothetical protein
VILLLILPTAYLGEELWFSGLSDRLLLAHFLVYGIVIGSFDLVRRRSLVASLILGGLLLGLISEFVFNAWFLIFPAVFTLLALTAVAVGSVETEAGRSVLVGEPRWLGAGKVWVGFATGALMLSAVLFLVMPRFVTAQVAQASWLPSRIDLTLGGPALLPSRPSASVSPGILASLPDGEVLDDRKYATLGYVGSLGDRAVMHVRSRVSSYWRGLTLDEYDGRGWLSSSPEIKLFNERQWGFIFPDSRANMAREKVYWQTYFMLSDQPNAVFTGYNPGRVYLPQTDQAYLQRGTVYRALSPVPYLRPESLRRDRAALSDLFNLALPPISDRVAALAESIVEGAPTDYDKAARLERFLLLNYPYDLNVKPLPPGRDAVDFFLFEQQAGYCSQFATAMAVMARQVGLPARVAAGYLPGVINPMIGAHTVRVGDAHAWVEIHFQKYGWVAFDPTPRPDAAMGFATGRNWVYFGLQDLVGVTFASALSPLAGNFSLGSLSAPRWVWAALFGAGVATALLALLLTRHKPGTRQEVREYSALRGEARQAMLDLYRRMVSLLVKKGLPHRQASQSLDEYAALICPQIPHGRETVEWLTRATGIAAYDPRPFNPATAREATERLSALRQALSGRR